MAAAAAAACGGRGGTVAGPAQEGAPAHAPRVPPSPLRPTLRAERARALATARSNAERPPDKPQARPRVSA
eukprot:4811663-Prymnesium_polylepis.3